MRRSLIASIVTSGLVVLALTIVAAPARAQQPADPNWKPEGPVPRTADGKPDLSGVWWQGADLPVVGLSVGTATVRRAAAAGSTFASLYQPWAVEKAKTLSDKDDPALRCVPSVDGPQMSNVFQIMQTPKLVARFQETYHGFRLIPIGEGRAHNEDTTPAFSGDSVGHWEGDTLVVDVTNFSGRNWIVAQGNVSFHSDALHIVERYRRIAANALEIEKIYEDPKTLVGPWTPPKKTFRLAPFDQVMEAVCTSTETAALMEAAAKDNYGLKK
jgi:hypothetical protein